MGHHPDHFGLARRVSGLGWLQIVPADGNACWSRPFCLGCRGDRLRSNLPPQNRPGQPISRNAASLLRRGSDPAGLSIRPAPALSHQPDRPDSFEQPAPKSADHCTPHGAAIAPVRAASFGASRDFIRRFAERPGRTAGESDVEPASFLPVADAAAGKGGSERDGVGILGSYRSGFVRPDGGEY